MSKRQSVFLTFAFFAPLRENHFMFKKRWNKKPRAESEDETPREINPEKSRPKTFDRAVNLLTYKPRSVKELRERLLEKDWTNEQIVDEVIEKLKIMNLFLK